MQKLRTKKEILNKISSDTPYLKKLHNAKKNEYLKLSVLHSLVEDQLKDGLQIIRYEN